MNTREYSRLQENQVAKKLSGSVVANSGATAFHKGDVRTGKFLIECKTHTEKKSGHTIREDELLKNRKEAFSQGKEYSALAFRFEPNGKDYFVIDSNLMELLVNHLEKEGN